MHATQLVPYFDSVLLFQNKTYSLEYSKKANQYCLVTINSGLCNWIIRYDFGKIGYDKKVVDSLHTRILRCIDKHYKQ